MILLESIPYLDCAFVSYLGAECPGCGFQRAIVALFSGELLLSLQLFPALIPILFMGSYLLLHLKFQFKQGANVLKYTFIFNALLVIISYIIKQL